MIPGFSIPANSASDLTISPYSTKTAKTSDYNNISKLLKYWNEYRKYRIRSKHLYRMGFIMERFKVKEFAMLTLTVVFDGTYKTSSEYNKALQRVRSKFNYYNKTQKITGSEFTKKGVRHYHLVFPSDWVVNFTATKSFQRFQARYQFTEDDLKAIRSGARSYLEVLVARWFAKFWRLGFCDLQLHAKALYLVKYTTKSYKGLTSEHGRISYSRGFSKFFRVLSSITKASYNNTTKRVFKAFQAPFFVIAGLQKQFRRAYLQSLVYRAVQDAYDVERARRNFINPDKQDKEVLYKYVERLGFLLGY